MSALPGGSDRRMYRRLLFLLPPDMRDEFGDDMVRLFGDRLREAGTSWVARFRVWGTALIDLASHALAARWDKLPAHQPSDDEPDGVAAASRRHAARRDGGAGDDRLGDGGTGRSVPSEDAGGAPAGTASGGSGKGGQGRSPAPLTPGIAGRLDSLRRDLVTAGRRLRERPGFTFVAVGTLALGIGANTAIFTVVDGVLLQPLPYHEPERLVRVWPEENFNKAMVDRILSGAPAVESMTGVSGWLFTLTGEGQPEQISGALVSHDHFEVLGVQPRLGRTFTPQEGTAGHADAVILSHGVWMSLFGGDPDVVGRRIRLAAGDYSTRRVVGVMPPGYRPLEPHYRLWAPLDVEPGLGVREDRSWYVNVLVGRLAGGATREQAEAQVRAIGASLHSEWPARFDEESGRATVVPLLADVVGDFRQTLWTLLGAVGVVLLIACANVANLLLARTEERQRDLALRAALGATRGRLLAQQLVESLVLGLAGGTSGLALAWASLRLLTARAPEEIPRLGEVSVDGTVLAFTLAASVVATLLFGLVPAWRALARDLRESLGGSSRGAVAPGEGRLNGVLVAAEVALALVLVVGAGLMARSLQQLYDEDTGFDPGGVLSLRLALPEGRFEDDALRAYHREVQEVVGAVPGVTDVGAIHLLPLTGSNWNFPYFAEDHPVPEGTPPLNANFRVVVPGYFRTLEIPVVRGRAFTRNDTASGRPVGIINETMARQLWPDDDPLGKEIRLFYRDAEPFTVVGVVGDIRQHGVRSDARPEMYRPLEQYPIGGMFLVVRSRGRPTELTDSIRRAVWSVDPDVPIAQVRSMDEVFGQSVAEDRFLTLLITAFGSLALLLGLMGVYGVTAYVVSRRLPEFGVRMLLGARPGTVMRQALFRGLRPVVVGIVFGLVGARWGARLLESLLHEVGTDDPVTFWVVPLALLATAIAACAVPAWRAARADPMVALRDR